MTRALRLPPLQALQQFEAAARHLNFTTAARELGSTQPAVSQRMAALEAELGITLFRRAHRGVTLTSDGAHLFEAVHDGLQRMAEAVERLRAAQDGTVLTVGTDYGFAACWLMPRLAQLRAVWPELDVRIVTTQGALDVRADGLDLAIVFGQGRWSGCEAERLCDERVVPVCSPEFAAAHAPALRSAATLRALPLLHLESPRGAPWADWADWFAGQGLPQTPLRGGLTLNNHTLVLQAAMTGQGLALAWRPLVDALLDSGQLVIAHPGELRTARGYFVVQPAQQRPGPTLRRFKDWILGGGSLAAAPMAAPARPVL